MKNIITLVFFLLVANVQAQINAVWSEPSQPPITNADIVKPIGPIGDSIIFVVYGQKSTLLTEEVYFLETYQAKTLIKTSSQQLSIPFTKAKDKNVIGFLPVENTLCVFFSDFNRANQKNYLRVSQFNAKGQPIKDNILLDSIEVFSASRRGTFNITTNPQKTNFLVFPVEPFEKAANQKIRYSIWDKNLNPITQRNFDMPYKAREVELTQLNLGEDDNAYFLIKITDLFRRWSPGLPNFKYVMIESFSTSNEIKEYEVTLPGKSISNLGFSLNNETLTLLGLYSDNAKTQEESSGYFYIQINTQQRKIVNSNFQGYPKTLMGQYLNENQLLKGKELEEFLIVHFMPHINHTASFATEQYLFREVCTTDMRTGIVSCQQYYYYNDIVEFNLNTDGSLNGFKVIKKAHYSTNESCADLSFLAFADQNINYYMFYDNPKNSLDSKSRNEKLKTYEEGGKGRLLLVKSTKNQLEAQEVSLGLARDENLWVNLCVKLSDKSYLAYAGNKKSVRFGILKLSE